MDRQIGQPTSSPRVTLAADLRLLSAALDDPETDLDELLRSLTADIRLAVPSYLGLTMSLVFAGDAIGWTVLDDDVQPGSIGASALLPLPALCDVEAESVIIFYAATPGAFVDFAADVSFALGVDLSTVVLDQHLLAPTGAAGVSGLSDMSLVNQAVGILTERVGSVGGARTELYRLARVAKHTVLLAAKQVIRSTALRTRPSPPSSGRSTADALLAVDFDGQIRYLDDQVELMFGWRSTDLLGQSIERLIPTRLWNHDEQLRDQFLAHPVTRTAGGGLRLDLRAVHRDGSEFPVDVNLRAIRSVQAALIGVAIRDLTGRGQGKPVSSRRLADTTEAMLGIDADNRIALVGERAEALFGWTPGELLGKPADMLLTDPFPVVAGPVVAGEDGQGDAGVVGSWLSDDQVDVEALHKDRSTFAASFTTRAVSGPGVIAAIVSIHATSPAAHAPADTAATTPRETPPEVQRERLQRMELLGELAGGVAHDFNNLLGVIQNYAVLLTRQVTAPRALADLEEIRIATERAAVLTRQLLMFSRSVEIVHEAVELNQVINGAASMLGRTLGAHIKLRLKLDEGPLLVLADAQQLEQIVLNLVINARDAMPAGGNVTIRTGRQFRANGDAEHSDAEHSDAEHSDAEHSDAEQRAGSTATAPEVVLQVIDEGVGMTPEVVRRAFEPFFTTKLRGDGTGLGLASVKSIVKRSGGTVGIESTEGHGTTITILLQPAGDVRPAGEGVADSPVGGHEKILLVEDEPTLREATERILAARGYDVVTAANGVEALEIFDSADGSIELVLSDVAMPRMRGDELARILFHRHTGLPVILMTGYNFGDSPENARHLTKPVSEETLLRAIRLELDPP